MEGKTAKLKIEWSQAKAKARIMQDTKSLKKPTSGGGAGVVRCVGFPAYCLNGGEEEQGAAKAC